MAYQVLARKWRPRKFAELVGQEHVVRALSHALDSGRIHHAFLFTGTRGVGKTTIARIFAKSLNCETGVGANPCGECASCRDIDAGRFVDLLEIDAASRTKVDDTREMLDNVIYAPARGRYKVYLIDEVHMLSGHSFNALLKTLEEPPPHVKFLLATTDPQKLPVTVLSRCLQFNLKRLGDDQIARQLEKILGAEEIPFDDESVREIARGGNGSLRDALSLLDQAIAFGGGKLVAEEVRAMLGTIDRSRVQGLVEAIANGDATALYAQIVEVAEFAPDFANVLDEIAGVLHRVQLAQFVPATAEHDEPLIARLAARLAAEEVQLLYQIAILGRRDLGLAPSPRAGFEMSLLRMLAFRPAGPGEGGGAGSGGGARESAGRASTSTGGSASSGAPVASAIAHAPVTSSSPPTLRVVASGAAAAQIAPPVITPPPPESASRRGDPNAAAAAARALGQDFVRPPESRKPVSTVPTRTEEARAPFAPPTKRPDTANVSELRVREPAGTTPAMPPATSIPMASAEPNLPREPVGPADPTREGPVDLAQWRQALENAGLRGPLRELAYNAMPLGWQAGRLRLGLGAMHEQLRTDAATQKLADALAPFFGTGLKLAFEKADQATQTLAAQLRREDAERHEQARASIAADPVVQSLITHFDARIVTDSTRPLN